MKTILSFYLFCFLFVAPITAEKNESDLPSLGAVPNEETAIKIGEAVLLPLYGEPELSRARPLHARLEHGIWTVYGAALPHTYGGILMVELQKSDGKIIRITKSI